MTRIHRTLLLALALMLASVNAEGFNLSFLQDAPVSHLNDEDIDLLLQAADEALEGGEDGTDTWWENPRTGSNGSVTPVRSFEHNGLACRLARIATFAGGRSGTSELRFCKTAEGKWVVVPQP